MNPLWLTFVYFIIAYLIYWFAPQCPLWTRVVRGKSEELTSRNSLYLQKFLGFLLLGPASLWAAALWGPAGRFGLSWPSGPRALLWFLIPSAVSLAAMALRPVKSLNIKYYPQVRVTNWSGAELFRNTLFWSLYLFSYEFAFRGLMFFPVLDEFGFWPAAIVGSVIYSCVHIPKGAQEAIIALPYGLLLYYIAMDTSSMLIPFVLHLILALMNDYRSLAVSPVMRVVRKSSGNY